MSTTATVETPTGQWYFIDTTKSTEEIIYFLEDIVEQVMWSTNVKYKNADENWEEELQRQMDTLSESTYSDLELHDSHKNGKHHYEITEDKEVVMVS